MRDSDDVKPEGKRPAQKDAGVLSVFRVPKPVSDADRLSGMQRSLTRQKMGLAVPGGVGSRESGLRRMA